MCYLYTKIWWSGSSIYLHCDVHLLNDLAYISLNLFQSKHRSCRLHRNRMSLEYLFDRQTFSTILMKSYNWVKVLQVLACQSFSFSNFLLVFLSAFISIYFNILLFCYTFILAKSSFPHFQSQTYNI